VRTGQRLGHTCSQSCRSFAAGGHHRRDEASSRTVLRHRPTQFKKQTVKVKANSCQCGAIVSEGPNHCPSPHVLVQTAAPAHCNCCPRHSQANTRRWSLAGPCPLPCLPQALPHALREAAAAGAAASAAGAAAAAAAAATATAAAAAAAAAAGNPPHPQSAPPPPTVYPGAALHSLLLLPLLPLLPLTRAAGEGEGDLQVMDAGTA